MDCTTCWFVRELEADLWTLKRKEAFRVFQVELANTRAAWDWAVASQRVDEIEQTTPAMYDFFLGPPAGGPGEHFGTTFEFFGSVAERLDETNPGHLAALGTVLVHQVFHPGQMHRHQDYLRVRSVALRGIGLLRSQGEPRGLSRGFLALGESFHLAGEFSQAREWYRQALAIARTRGESSDVFHALRSTGLAKETVGPNSRQFIQEALEEVRALNNMPGITWFLMGSGGSLVSDKRFEESKAHFREAIRLARELGYHMVVIFSLRSLAEASLGPAEIEQAAAHAEEAHQVVEETGLTHFAPYTFRDAQPGGGGPR